MMQQLLRQPNRFRNDRILQRMNLLFTLTIIAVIGVDLAKMTDVVNLAKKQSEARYLRELPPNVAVDGDSSFDDMLSDDEAKTPLFHMIFSTGDDTVSTLNMRSIESIFYFHPEARLRIHTKKDTGVSGKKFQALVEKGYDITIVHYEPEEVLREAMDVGGSEADKKVANEFIAKLPELVKEKFWYANETDLLRMCLLYLQGGIYLDTDVILISPVLAADDRIDNAMAQNRNKFECAVMKFTKPGNLFLAATISNYLNNYNGLKWAHNGPQAFGRTAKEHPELVCEVDKFDYINNVTADGNVEREAGAIAVSDTLENPTRKCWLNPLPKEAFQPVSWKSWGDICFSEQSPVDEEAKEPMTKSYVVHLNNKKSGDKLEAKAYKPGSLCDLVLSNFCVLCE